MGGGAPNGDGGQAPAQDAPANDAVPAEPKQEEPKPEEEEKDEEDDPRELNPHVLATIAQYNAKHGGKGYWWPSVNGDLPGKPGSADAVSARWKGNIESVDYLGKLLTRDGGPASSPVLANIQGGKSFCIGVTYEVFFKAIELYCGATGKDYSTFQISTLTKGDAYGMNGTTFWPSWRGFAGSAAASVGCGIGVKVSAADAKAGDFAQIKRANGSGHSVIVIEMLSGNRIKYWGTQPATDGVGENTEGYASIEIGRVNKLPG